ncbi:MAG TPA: arsenic metallochaperone ArsD family protein, partial [Oscillospiraceae bacterium]|nr:arsenic metallochaperone ArsD family protein [Oscillospiraceae bacterium]
MKKMAIYEPAMCCPTGLCGVGVNPELLRISAALAALEKNGIKVERYNLTSAPQEFVKNAEVGMLLSKGVGMLPVTVLDLYDDARVLA